MDQHRTFPGSERFGEQAADTASGTKPAMAMVAGIGSATAAGTITAVGGEAAAAPGYSVFRAVPAAVGACSSATSFAAAPGRSDSSPVSTNAAPSTNTPPSTNATPSTNTTPSGDAPPSGDTSPSTATATASGDTVVSGDAAGSACQHGLSGSLVLQGVDALDEQTAGAVLCRLDQLMRWAQAQQARVLHRMEIIYRNEMHFPSGKPDPGMAFTLAASEAAAILCVPQSTGQRLMSEAGSLCRTHSVTLASLEQGGISYGHAQTVLDQSQDVESVELPGFEAKLLEAAAGQTPAQFRVRARRLRENQYPQGIVQRQLSALEKRKVCLEPAADGMSWLSAFLPAENAQAIFTQLSRAARGEQADGDPRRVDELRADILQDLLMSGGGPSCGHGPKPAGKDASGTGTGTGSGSGIGTGTDCGSDTNADARAKARAGARTEILVLISAETLFGADDQPAELHGYGPISPEAARRMAREAAKWTPVERDPDTEEILRVGRRRKVRAGLQRWLRARDGTCRFPGCRTNAVISEIDHTRPWVQGGATDHDNLEHLCRRHHMFKTQGFWKACQPVAGVIEWISPGGRTYRTEPHLSLAPVMHGTCPEGAGGRSVAAVRADARTVTDADTGSVTGAGARTVTDEDARAGSSADDYGDDPPPF